MNHIHSLRAGTGLMALAAIMFLMAFNLGGCAETEDSPTNPAITQAPALPASEQLKFDFSFFDSADQMDKASGDYDNFVNAYLRTVFLEVMAHLVLTAPVDAFSSAIHTVPTSQPDGSWRWTYDWQIADERMVVVLIGLPVGDVVQWELRLVPAGSDREYLWFSGTTSDRGEQGHWVFLDLDDEEFPICGEIAWGPNADGNFLEFISRRPESNGDRLAFYDNEPEFRIEYTLGSEQDSSFIHWHANGDGSLRVPDYNGGVEACWDVYQQDVDCQ